MLPDVAKWRIVVAKTGNSVGEEEYKYDLLSKVQYIYSSAG